MLELDYHDTITMDYGPKALLYKISNRTFQNGPDKECTCQKGLCVDGISDTSPCFYGKTSDSFHLPPETIERLKKFDFD